MVNFRITFWILEISYDLYTILSLRNVLKVLCKPWLKVSMKLLPVLAYTISSIRMYVTPNQKAMDGGLNQHLVAITISVPVEDLSDRGPEGVTRNNFHMY